MPPRRCYSAAGPTRDSPRPGPSARASSPTSSTRCRSTSCHPRSGEPEWQNTTVLSGDLAEEVNRIRESTDGDVVVHGSAQLVQALIEHDLVDELRLMVFPVIL